MVEEYICKNDSLRKETSDIYDAGTAGLDFELINNNTTYCVRKGTVTSGEVFIPVCRLNKDTGEYLPVTAIGDNAFSHCKNLTGITIPAGVTAIGEHAFYRCTGLAGIIIPASVTKIDKGAFSSCTSLTGITIPPGVTDADTLIPHPTQPYHKKHPPVKPFFAKKYIFFQQIFPKRPTDYPVTKKFKVF